VITDTIKKNTETLIDANKEVGKHRETKNMLLSRHQNAGQNHDMKITNRSFENVAQFKYLGMTVINQNLIQEEIKRILNLGHACNHSVQNLLISLKSDIQNYNFACGSVWAWNLVPDIKRGR
jgi:hypothetical protein